MLVLRTPDVPERWTVFDGFPGSLVGQSQLESLTQTQLVRVAETLTIGIRQYNQAYRMWIALPEAQKTFLNPKKQFTAEYQMMNQMQRLAKYAGYHGANVAQSKTDIRGCGHEFFFGVC